MKFVIHDPSGSQVTIGSDDLSSLDEMVRDTATTALTLIIKSGYHQPDGGGVGFSGELPSGDFVDVSVSVQVRKVEKPKDWGEAETVADDEESLI